MKTSLGNQGAGPVTEGGDEQENKTQPSQSISPRNCFPTPGISVLDKLIKTCPAWLQLSLSKEKAAEILGKEPAGIFMVRKDEKVKHLFLSVHYPTQTEASEVLEYNIKEEKLLLYLEGSLLVFEDIFKLIAFYCVSRDLLPFTLRLPQAILEANSFTDLEIISSLGIGFWGSSLNQRRGGRFPHPVKGPPFATAQEKKVKNASQCFASSTNNCSCEIELSIGNDRLWFVNPIFIEERNPWFPLNVTPLESCRESPSFSSDILTRPQKKSPSRRPPPPPPPPAPPPSLHALKKPDKPPMTTSEEDHLQDLGKKPKGDELRLSKRRMGESPSFLMTLLHLPFPISVFLLPFHQGDAQAKGLQGQAALINLGKLQNQEGNKQQNRVVEMRTVSKISKAQKKTEVLEKGMEETSSEGLETKLGNEAKEKPTDLLRKPSEKSTGPPVPPPRKKRFSRHPSSASCGYSKHMGTEELEVFSPDESTQPKEKKCSDVKRESNLGLKLVSISDCEGSRDSLHCPVSNVGLPTPSSEPDSYSTSSTEDELESVTSPSVKKTRSMILGRARHRLSMVSLSNVFTAFLSADRKLQKKIVELAQDKDSYFGNLVQDYKVYSLEMMAKQSSSTEMLQEIRLMMTQLKSYLIQSMELKSFIDQTVHTDEQLEVIIESALHKCVLKPLKEAIDTYLREIHSKDGSLKLLKENQQVIQNTTTTDLGVTTSVPEGAVLEKILHKFTTMHKAYSPEKKISILLKSCKLIYDSMTQGNPGKPYGADDFLPVLMYVLARSDLMEVLLNVEYMMELMDPALQLGEGSYYLITTYGAVELIKSYDKITVTRQLSTEVQDSIHRWERRRTLNKARASRSSVQDFIAISFMEADVKARTLAYRTDATTQQLSQQCAEKFEVSEPQNYSLFVQVDDKSMRLDDDALPHRIKSHLLNKEPKPTFYFIYKPMGSEETTVPIIKDPDLL
ncbi:LOW QUALITY PROTEIN: ras and Rab interactor 3 [Sceloporus undulatus]|uniref:LOW QUALITY PROTEIN: ras and Rab interactor 3 n=1 Tax=Sceloporus undulatus TaxID=8520 RepID=UPI001C4D047C|nr:LOW QUALITY PROTEIN: ras and Rab interactor 3 [Sceloporus undulatus]